MRAYDCFSRAINPADLLDILDDAMEGVGSDELELDREEAALGRGCTVVSVAGPSSATVSRGSEGTEKSPTSRLRSTGVRSSPVEKVPRAAAFPCASFARKMFPKSYSFC